MQRLAIFILSIVIFVSCQSGGYDAAALYAGGEGDGTKKPTTSGGTIALENDSSEFKQVLKEHANYGKLFDSIMESAEDDIAVFDDYIASEEYIGLPFSDLGDKLALDFVGGDDFEIYY